MTPPPEPTEYLKGLPWWKKVLHYLGWWPGRQNGVRP